MATIIDSYKGNSNLVELSTANIEFATKTFNCQKKTAGHFKFNRFISL